MEHEIDVFTYTKARSKLHSPSKNKSYVHTVSVYSIVELFGHGYVYYVIRYESSIMEWNGKESRKSERKRKRKEKKGFYLLLLSFSHRGPCENFIHPYNIFVFLRSFEMISISTLFHYISKM